MIRIRMLKPFRALKAGIVLDQHDGVAEMWIRSGRAERVVERPGGRIENMVPAPPAIRADINVTVTGENRGGRVAGGRKARVSA